MEIQREGMRVYACRVCPQNPYFLRTEYQILRCNQPKGLLIMQIREKNGEKALLYDITGYKTLTAMAEERNFSLSQCRGLVQGLYEILGELEEYMLEETYLCFDPQEIYCSGKEEYRWMYYPEFSSSSDAKAEQLFQWMLSRIDYGDMDTVQFMYHAFWRVRNQTFSAELLVDCLRYHRNPVEEYQPESYEEYFPEPETEEESEEDFLFSQPGKGMNREGKEEKTEKKKGMKALFIVCAGMLCVCSLFCVFLLVQGLQQGYTSLGIRCQVGVIFLIVVLADVCYQVYRRERREGEVLLESEECSPFWMSGDVFAETGKTEVLSVSGQQFHPALKDRETGSVHLIHTSPFYIGHEKGLNQLSMAEPTVSRRHAVILQGNQTGKWEIQDLHSTNGTWVNQVILPPEEPVALKTGDEIRFAEKAFQFLLLEGLPE